MTHFEMERFKKWLVAENVKRLGEGHSVVEPFYPSDFLRGDDSTDVDKFINDGSKPSVARRKPLENYFQHFVFVKATSDDITELVEEDKKLGYRFYLVHYKDTDGRNAIVSSDMMELFFDACLKYRGYFEIAPPMLGIETRDCVEIKVGPFAGQKASVVRVQHVHGEVSLELELEFVNGVMNIIMHNVSRNDVTILNRSTVDAIRTDFIEYTQTHLLEIMEHRVKGINDEDVKQQDLAMLTRLFRYRKHHVENAAAQAHFLSLMLICAHLCRYTADEQELKEKALASLAEINSRPASKAATDTRTYLWIALYVVTRDPSYREAAKQYIRDCQPKSERLRRFVTLIRTGKRF